MRRSVPLDGFSERTQSLPALIAYLNAITLPAQLLDGAIALKGLAIAAKSATLAKEGIYFFKVGEKWYVGQSGDIARRLSEHLAKGILEDGVDVQRIEVLGGKTAREVAEHLKIQEFTGNQAARHSDQVLNKVDPIGQARSYLLPK